MGSSGFEAGAASLSRTMLGQWHFEAAMIRPVQCTVPASPLPAPRGCGRASGQLSWTLRYALRAAPLAVLLTCGGSLGRAQTQPTSSRQQTAGEPTGQSAPLALPSDPAAISGARLEVPARGLNSAAPGVGQDSDQSQTTKANAVAGSRARFWPSSGSGENSFPANSSLGNPNGVAPGSMGLNFTSGTAIGQRFSGGFNPIGGAGFAHAGFGGRSANAAPLFSPGNGSMNRTASGALSPSGIAPVGLPSLNQLLRGNLAMPLSSSSSAFRISYRDALRPGGRPSELGRGSGSILFSSSDLGNGIFFSAGTGYGSRTASEAPSSSFGLTNAPAAKHSGPALNLKLSF
jgi:hypothetical protein